MLGSWDSRGYEHIGGGENQMGQGTYQEDRDQAPPAAGGNNIATVEQKPSVAVTTARPPSGGLNNSSIIHLSPLDKCLIVMYI